jgi:hypothetical protein
MECILYTLLLGYIAFLPVNIVPENKFEKGGGKTRPRKFPLGTLFERSNPRLRRLILYIAKKSTKL